MKIRNLLICSLFSVVLGACSYEPDEMPVTVDQSYPIRLFNEIEQIATTRVNDEGFCNGDEVGIYVVNYNGSNPGRLAVEGNQADNVRYTYDEGNNQWTPEESVYFKDKNTHVDIIGYYPYGSPSSVDAYAFELSKDQSTEAENGLLGGYEASDFLWGKATDIAPTSQRIAVKFQHRMAGVLVTLTEGTGFDTGEFARLEKSVLVTNTIRKALIDLATGEVTPTGDVPTTGTIPYHRDGDFRAVVVPQTVEASTPLFSITVDGGYTEVADSNEMVMDGEGATKFIHVEIEHARSVADAKLCAEAVANSLLCKTAWFGGDPNWGRVVAALGYSGAKFDPEKTDIYYDNMPVVRNGGDAGTPESALCDIVKQREFTVRVNLHDGDDNYWVWTSDVSYEYVKINADYHT